MEFKGTGGKWKVNPTHNENEHGAQMINIDTDEYYSIISVYYAPEGNDMEEAEANAKLIASAPLLLQKLIDIHWLIENGGTSDIELESIKELINQATN